MIDTHTHYAHAQYDPDRAEALKKAFDTGVDALINIAITYESNEQMRELFQNYDNIYYTIGIHPCRITEEDCDKVEERLKDLDSYADFDKVVAVGETGLDYYRVTDTEKREIQKIWFRHHIALALKKNLPLVLHIRGESAMEDALEILDEYPLPEMPGVCHCFVSGKEAAKEWLKRGFYLGIGGQITHRKVKELRESMEIIPMERIVLETDCPFLAPAGHDSKRNGSDALPLIVRVISQLKQVSLEEVMKITDDNAKRLFRFA